MLKKVKEYCNSNPGFAQVIGNVIWVILATSLGSFVSIFGNKFFWILLLFLAIWAGIWFIYKDRLLRYGKITIVGLVVISSLVLVWTIWSYFWLNQNKANPPPVILNLTDWFELLFEDSFTWWNLSENSNFQWWNKDDKVTNSLGSWVTIKTSSALYQSYPIFQDLQRINRDYILLNKFYVPEGSRVSTQFMNTQKIDSDLYLGFHFQECVLNAYKWTTTKGEEYNKWYWSYLYERKPVWPPNFNKNEISPWVYYMLVSVTSGSFSCYIQKDWDQNYITVVKKGVLKYTNLGWPALSRMTEWLSSYPKILDFKLFLRK